VAVPAARGKIEELEKPDFAGVQIQFDHLEAELLCSNSRVTISVQMTLQAGVLQEFR